MESEIAFGRRVEENSLLFGDVGAIGRATYLVDESREARRIMLPFVRNEKCGPLVASLEPHYDMPRGRVARSLGYETPPGGSSTEGGTGAGVRDVAGQPVEDRKCRRSRLWFL